ncbi:MAG: CapA family protein [Leptospiraceae bacterium]|nr:CapA family protein [Leptospiraceae bacterium]
MKARKGLQNLMRRGAWYGGLLLTLALVLTGWHTGRGVAAQAPTEEQSGRAVTFSVIGDIMCHDKQLASAWNAKTGQHDFDRVFQTIKSRLSRADLTIANLETTLPGKPALYAGYPQFGSPDSLAAAVKNAGVDVLTLANNHSVDKQALGIKRTISVTQKLGFRILGTYASVADYNQRRLLQVNVGGLRLILLNYTYGTNGLKVPKGMVVNMIEARRIRSDIALARKAGPDAIMVLFHFGTEYQRHSSAYQQKWVNYAIEEGADIVMGGHPHVLQPFGVRRSRDKYGYMKERLITWSLGNFVSNQQRRYTDGGMIFNFSLRRNPDASSPQKLLFSNISYEPVWVYVDKRTANHQFHILPVNDYIKNKMPLTLDRSGLAKMQLFYKDTTAHLQPSMLSVAAWQ